MVFYIAFDDGQRFLSCVILLLGHWVVDFAILGVSYCFKKKPKRSYLITKIADWLQKPPRDHVNFTSNLQPQIASLARPPPPILGGVVSV